MEIGEVLRMVAGLLIGKLPVLLVLLGGIGYCVFNFSKNPKTNRLALGGMIVLFALEILSLFLPILGVYLSKNYTSGNTAVYISFATVFVISLFYAIGLGMILCSVWQNRTPQ